MSDVVTIYEPLYHRGQHISDSTLAAFDWFENPIPEWRELAIFERMYTEKTFLNAQLTGLFSPKFALKTGVDPSEFLNFARRNFASDVCFINPFPQIPYFSFNVWMQGEVAHPGITQRAQDLLDSCKIAWDLNRIGRQSSDIVCYSNFWVGSSKFWEQYVGSVLMPITIFLKSNSHSSVAKAVLEPTMHTDPSPYLPFIIERLFSTFLSVNTEVTRTAWQFSYREIENLCTNQYEKTLFHNMYERIKNADALQFFPDSLKNEMNDKCQSWQDQFWEYFSVHDHPHTGHPLNHGLLNKEEDILSKR